MVAGLEGDHGDFGEKETKETTQQPPVDKPPWVQPVSPATQGDPDGDERAGDTTRVDPSDAGKGEASSPPLGTALDRGTLDQEQDAKRVRRWKTEGALDNYQTCG